MDVEALKSIFTTLPVDLVASVLFATFITVVTLRFGASLAISFSLAMIFATVLYGALPTAYMIGPALAGLTSAYAAAGIYGGMVLLLTFMLYRATSTLSDDSGRPLFALATGLATTVIVLTVWEMFPVLQSLWHFNGAISSIFGATYRLYWLVLGFIAFAFVKS